MKHLNNIFWLVLLISQGTSVLAQLPFGQTDNCDDFDATTFLHTVDRTAPDNWDWRDASFSNWWVHMKSQDGKPIPSPFQPSTPEYEKNVLHLQSGFSDYEPSDGWELLFRWFGEPTNEVTKTPAPVFILYNRFTGIMRVFIWAEFDDTFNQAALLTQFSSARSKGTALLGLISNPVSAAEGFNPNLISATPNAWDNCQNCGSWLFADIPTLYDPCTCEQTVNSANVLTPSLSEIFVGGQLIRSQKITLAGVTQPTDTASMAPKEEESTNFSFNEVLEGVNNAGKFFKVTNDLIDAIKKTQAKDADKSKKPIDTQQQSTQPESKPAPADAEAESLKDFKIPEIMKVIPKIGPWLTVLDVLITGGKKNNTTSTSQAGALTQSKFSGELKLEAPLKGASYYTPGSEFQNIPQRNESKDPVYDHILGIFNLVEEPVLEVVTYQPSEVFPSDYFIHPQPTPTQNYIFVLPPVKQYRLKPIKYVVNPSSELELVDLDISIQYRINGSPVDTLHKVSSLLHYHLGFIGPLAIGTPLGETEFDATSYIERLRIYGIDTDFWPIVNGSKPNDIRATTFTTGFFPAQCEDVQSIFIAMPDENTPHFSSLESSPTFTLKVRAILRRTDSEAVSTTEDVLFMATYDVALNSIAGGGSYQISPNPNPMTLGFIPLVPTYLRDYVATGFTSSLGNQAYFPLGNNGLPFDLTIENETINTGTFEALSSISVFNSDLIHSPTAVACDTIGGQIICGNVSQDPIVLRARNLISIDPDGLASSDIGPGTTMIMELPARFNGCDADPMPSPATYAEIQAICQDGNKYNPVIASRQEAADSTIVKELLTIPLTAQPNPFTNELTLSYELPAEAQVQMQLVDMMGRPVRQILPTSHRKAGSHEIQVDLNGLAAGMYTVILQAGKHRQTVKVVKR